MCVCVCVCGFESVKLSLVSLCHSVADVKMEITQGKTKLKVVDFDIEGFIKSTGQDLKKKINK